VHCRVNEFGLCSHILNKQTLPASEPKAASFLKELDNPPAPGGAVTDPPKATLSIPLPLLSAVVIYASNKAALLDKERQGEQRHLYRQMLQNSCSNNFLSPLPSYSRSTSSKHSVKSLRMKRAHSST